MTPLLESLKSDIVRLRYIYLYDTWLLCCQHRQRYVVRWYVVRYALRRSAHSRMLGCMTGIRSGTVIVGFSSAHWPCTAQHYHLYPMEASFMALFPIMAVTSVRNTLWSISSLWGFLRTPGQRKIGPKLCYVMRNAIIYGEKPSKPWIRKAIAD